MKTEKKFVVSYRQEQNIRYKAYSDLLIRFKEDMEEKRERYWNNKDNEELGSKAIYYMKGQMYQAEEVYYYLKGRIKYLREELAKDGEKNLLPSIMP